MKYLNDRLILKFGVPAIFLGLVTFIPLHLDKQRGVRYSHPLREKLGFKTSGDLPYNRTAEYEIRFERTNFPFDNDSVAERVFIHSSDGYAVLIDKDYDGIVDQIDLPDKYGIIKKGDDYYDDDEKIEFKSDFDRQTLDYASKLFQKIKKDLDVENRMSDYTFDKSFDKRLDILKPISESTDNNVNLEKE